MKVIAEIITATLTNGAKRRMLELYSNEIGAYPHPAGSKEHYEAKELRKTAKDTSHQIMNLESYSMLYPIKIDGKLAESAEEAYILIAEGVMR